MIVSDLELELRDALAHLYDPGFQPSPKLCASLGCEDANQALAVQAKVIAGIECLKPAGSVPVSSRTVRYYEILNNRFVLRLTLEETALRMHMSLSSTWREQRAAIHSLASEFWRQNQARTSAAHENEPVPPAAQSVLEEPLPDWQAQTRRELACLQSCAPDVASDVGKLVQQVLDLEGPLAAKRGIRIETGQIQAGLMAAVHPSVLRQILIIAIGQFLRNMTGGKISLFARLEDGSVRLTVSGAIDPQTTGFDQAVMHELPLPDGANAEVYVDGHQVFLWVRLPYVVDRLNVLVVDDNQDMIRFYQRSTEGTSYRIVSFEFMNDLNATILKVQPDLILLDVMLPNIDGWDLLMQIRANPDYRHIPVIVCSVVKEEELAISLGAARFISKPTHPQEFVRALDQVLAQTP
jgi:CheY-like chemotaxis protein